jgi:hypothetical protein
VFDDVKYTRPPFVSSTSSVWSAACDGPPG